MEEHKKRVVKEKEELDIKIEALSIFINTNKIFTTLEEDEQEDLSDQLSAMKYYSRILQSRINRF